MRKSIKRTVFVRVAVLNNAQSAETAHYRWALNLSNALYAGGQFPGTDDTQCVLGKWVYGEAGTDNADILRLRSEIQPLHKQLHQSVGEAQSLMATSPAQAQKYYQETIQSNLGTLVGKLDEVIKKATELTQESTDDMSSTIMLMQAITAVCLVLALFCLISLVVYVLKNVLAPILHITRQVQPLQEGKLDLALDHKTNDELGDLAGTLVPGLYLGPEPDYGADGQGQLQCEDRHRLYRGVPLHRGVNRHPDLQPVFHHQQHLPGPDAGVRQCRAPVQRRTESGPGRHRAGQRRGGAVRHPGYAVPQRG